LKLKEIREEVIASGAQNIAKDSGGEARINRWIQQSYREICDFKPWPFLFDKAEGVAPLKVEDLGHVQAVVDVAGRNELEPITINQLLLGDPTQVGVGRPEYWYTEDGVTIKITPSSTGLTLRVLYRKKPAELTDEDEPIFDTDYHDLIVTRTRVKVYKATDNLEAAAEILKDYERERDGMVHALMKLNYDKERRLTRAGRRGDYL
jgi:hypothetical protein